MDPTPGTLVLAWQPEQEDYTEAIGAVNRRAHSARTIAVMVILMLALAAVGFSQSDPVLVAVGTTGALLLTLVTGPLRHRGIRKAWIQAILLHSYREIRLVPGQGIALISQGLSATWAWWAFDGFLETDRMMVLLFAGSNGMQIQLIAKRGLSPSVDVGVLRDLLAREISLAVPARPPAF